MKKPARLQHLHHARLTMVCHSSGGFDFIIRGADVRRRVEVGKDADLTERLTPCLAAMFSRFSDSFLSRDVSGTSDEVRHVAWL